MRMAAPEREMFITIAAFGARPRRRNQISICASWRGAWRCPLPPAGGAPVGLDCEARSHFNIASRRYSRIMVVNDGVDFVESGAHAEPPGVSGLVAVRIDPVTEAPRRSDGQYAAFTAMRRVERDSIQFRW